MHHQRPKLLLITICLLLTGCILNKSNPLPTATLGIPTPTLEPMAAVVNGEGITVAEYQAELDRYLSFTSETGKSSPNGLEPKTLILNELVDEVLLAQASYQSGFQLNAGDIDNRINQLATQVGGVQALQDWQNRNNYTEAGLLQSLRRSIAAAWMRDKIISEIPLVAEQIHARQLLFTDEQSALAVKAQLDSGADFTTLAFQYDPIAGGDLGWFPRGYLNILEVESAAFSVEKGKYTDIVKSAIGWHIILVIDRDLTHALSPDVLLTQQHQALSQWLAKRRTESTIDIML